MSRCSQFPFLGFGVGLRRRHYEDVLNGASGCDCFEAISENSMDTGGRPLTVLERVWHDRPVALHGVALSIAGTDPLDQRYLRSLHTLVDRVEPGLVTDHPCCTGAAAAASTTCCRCPIPKNRWRMSRSAYGPYRMSWIVK